MRHFSLSTKLDLRNADDLAILNTTIDEVWAKDIKLSVDETMSIKNMDKCFTITLPEHVYTTGHTVSNYCIVISLHYYKKTF